MATINQQPAALMLTGVISNPFNLLIDFTSITNAVGASVAWSAITSPTAIVTDQYGNSVAGSGPTVTSPNSFQLLIAWTAAQTVTISNAQGTRWAIEVTVSGTGPSSILGGLITFVPASYPSASTSTTAALSVSVGTTNASVAVSLGGASGITNLTSADGSISLAPSGSGPLVDLSVTHIDGGNAASD